MKLRDNPKTADPAATSFVGRLRMVLLLSTANNASFDYSSGLLLAEYRLSAGRFFLNTLPIREKLSNTPDAERLLRRAASEAGQPLEDLPADFDQYLRMLGC